MIITKTLFHLLNLEHYKTNSTLQTTTHNANLNTSTLQYYKQQHYVKYNHNTTKSYY